MKQRNLFWLLAATLGFLADLALPLVWGMIAMIPIFVVSWWIVYRSDWF